MHYHHFETQGDTIFKDCGATRHLSWTRCIAGGVSWYSYCQLLDSMSFSLNIDMVRRVVTPDKSQNPICLYMVAPNQLQTPTLVIYKLPLNRAKEFLRLRVIECFVDQERYDGGVLGSERGVRG